MEKTLGTKSKLGLYPKVKFNLKLKMITLISLLIVAILVIFALFLNQFISKTIEEQVGKRALNLAQGVAHIPEIKEAFELSNPSSVIQRIVTPIQEKTGAEFIVIGNRDGIRYSHPISSRIGEKMVGGDNKRALLHGQSYVSKKEGTLGLSIQGKVPIYSAGEIIGVVSVGFLNENIQEIINNQSKSIWYTLVLIVLLGIIGAIFISYYIKKLLFHMEPEEISSLYLQNEAILQSTHEGIIAIDHKGKITTLNVAAKRIITREDGQKDYIGTSIKELLPAFHNFRERFHGREMILGDNIVLINQTPMHKEGNITGVVFTFRKKSELQEMTEELLRIKQYANAQRAQTHEHSNKLHIILGLLLNNKLREAIDFIKKENNFQSNTLKILTEKVSDPLINALLQGKFNQAQELGISLSIHLDSHLVYQLNEAQRDALLTALGNVIENAFDEIKKYKNRKKAVSIFFSDIGDDIIFEIEDSGNGIKAQNEINIFEQGFSTKNGAHQGTGLALSRKVLHDIGGEIFSEEGDLGGACFIISVPKD
ncbi:ATP-binding protein [Oceanobacillus senegalensis]|uniref:ATP-binding protein n=1 Tax=Oceanobacillus senegalensis TaxID=1936063 RepID=UPI000A30A424|nr:sensor histidine kinase [Oceanobacillus senegalensis]